MARVVGEAKVGRGLRRGFWGWMARRRQGARLRDLDAASLRDIGISRGEAARESRRLLRVF